MAEYGTGKAEAADRFTSRYTSGTLEMRLRE